MKRVIIIRHGQTVLNRKKALQGRSDLPLNETGTAEAMQAKQLLDRQGIVFDRVYSSPLARAVETARIASGSDDIRTDERLIEMDYGPYEGQIGRAHV